MERRGTQPPVSDLLAIGVPFLVYVASAYRDVTYWDVGEMDTVPWILGIAHPTGFPAYVLIGWLFSHVVAVGTVAFRMSLLSAVAMSVAALFIARLVREATGDGRLGTGSAWFFAFGIAAWSRATRAEVHALSTCAIAVVLFCFYRWHRDGESRWFYAAMAVAGCGAAVHPVVVLLAPAVLALIVVHLHETSTRTLVAGVGIAVCAALPWYAYLPLRSAAVSAAGIEPGATFWDYDHPASLHGFAELVTGDAFDVAGGLRSIANPVAYSALPQYAQRAWNEWTPLGTILVVAGAAVWWRRDARFAFTLSIVAVTTVFFALGFADESDVQRYYLPSFAVAAIFAGLSGRLGGGRAAPYTAIALMASSVWMLVSGAVLFDQPHDGRARAEIDEIRSVTPDDAVLIGTWVLAPPLAYVAYVERGLGHRVVRAAWIGDELDDVTRWRHHRPMYVVGTPQGELPGFVLRRVASQTLLYRVIEDRSNLGKRPGRE